MPISCTVNADLASLTLTGDASLAWSPLPTPDASARDAEMLRARAVDAASAVAAALNGRRRLSVVCVDAEGALCLWLKAPSEAEPVLAATLRAATQDWGDSIAASTFQIIRQQSDRPQSQSLLQTLRKPVGKPDPAALTSAGAPLIAAPLSLVRLFLDALDARGIRADSVVTLWHAMTSAWNPAPLAQESRAILLVEPGDRVVWCWAKGSSLLAGGTARENSAEDSTQQEPHTPQPERAAARLALDWMTWTAHLGITPSNIIVVGPDHAEFVEQLRTRFPSSNITLQRFDDPVDETARRAETAADPNDPARSLVALANRPTRASRAQYRWTAAALLLLASALATMGWRMNQASARLASERTKAVETARASAESLNDPGLLSQPNLLRSLETRLVTLQNKPPPKKAPAPRPIHDETQRIIDVLSKHEGVRLVQLSIDMRQPNTLQLTVPDRRTGEEIRLALQQNAGDLVWTQGGAAIAGDQVLRLSGTWTTPERN